MSIWFPSKSESPRKGALPTVGRIVFWFLTAGAILRAVQAAYGAVVGPELPLEQIIAIPIVYMLGRGFLYLTAKE